MTDLLADLDEEQRAAALAVHGPVRIVAGAGTGKTRTVTHRIAHGVATGELDAGRTLAVTHSRKAAGELAERLHNLGAGTVDARTFHAAALRVARQFWARTARREPAPVVLAEREGWGLWRDALRYLTRTEPDSSTVREVVDEVQWARSRLVGRERYEQAAAEGFRDPELGPAAVVACWERYEQAKARLGKVDFADLLDIASELLDDESVAQAVRRRWAHVTVDEYQDVDPAQQRLLDAILGDSHEVCVVGDPRQAIYTWKGADASLLDTFPERHPGTQTFNLTRNYRSSPQILDWANRLARHPGTVPLRATRGPAQPPRVHRLDNELAEAAWVAGAARRAIASGTPPSEIAVLYRFNSAQARFEAAFGRMGVPVVVADDVTFFERDEVRAVLVPFGRAARAQPDAGGLELLGSFLARQGFDRDDPPPGTGAARTRWESHEALLELLEALPGAAEADASRLLSEVNALARRTGDRHREGVTLATLHRAKGLEWDVVFVVGATDGSIPSAYADTDEELAEEERLLHVGVTRARRELHVTWAAAGARGRPNSPSPFLLRLPRAERPAPREARRSGRRRQPIADAGEPSAACAHCAAPLRGVSPRRLGVCAACATVAPGALGAKARAVMALVDRAAAEAGKEPDALLSPTALLRLLDKSPASEQELSALPGVRLDGRWAKEVVAALR